MHAQNINTVYSTHMDNSAVYAKPLEMFIEVLWIPIRSDPHHLAGSDPHHDRENGSGTDPGSIKISQNKGDKKVSFLNIFSLDL